VVATCCGLVAAAEAKELLLARPPAPAIVVRGTRGGSATAAAALNALCALAAGRSAAGHSAP
jgi:precorrin-8X/cobalt-precorrin-8 methylmutase